MSHLETFEGIPHFQNLMEVKRSEGLNDLFSSRKKRVIVQHCVYCILFPRHAHSHLLCSTKKQCCQFTTRILLLPAIFSYRGEHRHWWTSASDSFSFHSIERSTISKSSQCRPYGICSLRLFYLYGLFTVGWYSAACRCGDSQVRQPATVSSASLLCESAVDLASAFELLKHVENRTHYSETQLLIPFWIYRSHIKLNWPEQTVSPNRNSFQFDGGKRKFGFL